MAEQEVLTITAPATSANLGPGFDVMALALDLSNEVFIVRREGPLVVHVEGEGADERAHAADLVRVRAARDDQPTDEDRAHLACESLGLR
jgi:homoserine kinase